jgi:hypothetical protein
MREATNAEVSSGDEASWRTFLEADCSTDSLRLSPYSSLAIDEAGSSCPPNSIRFRSGEDLRKSCAVDCDQQTFYMDT